MAENTVLSSFLDPTDYSVQTFGAMTNLTAEEEVPVRTLDSIAPEVMEDLPDARVFLKLDTQGWDLEVLRGAEGSLSIGPRSSPTSKARASSSRAFSP